MVRSIVCYKSCLKFKEHINEETKQMSKNTFVNVSKLFLKWNLKWSNDVQSPFVGIVVCKALTSTISESIYCSSVKNSNPCWAEFFKNLFGMCYYLQLSQLQMLNLLSSRISSETLLDLITNCDSVEKTFWGLTGFKLTVANKNPEHKNTSI